MVHIKKSTPILSTCALAVALCLSLAACSPGGEADPADQPQESAQEAVSVAVLTAEKGSLSASVRYSGKIMPVQEMTVTPKISGKVAQVNFDVGDRVKAGDALFVLDDADIRAQVDAAQAQLDLTIANYDRTVGGSTELQLETLRSQVTAAERAVANAQISYERQKELFEAGAVSKQALEAAETNLKTAQDQLAIARTNLDINENKIAPENASAAAAQVTQAQVALNNAKTQLENTVVRAEISGTISARSVERGGIVSPSAPAFTILDDSSVNLEFGVTDDMVTLLKPGNAVNISIAALNDLEIAGTITSVSPSANPQTQLYLVKVTIKNSDRALKVGMFGTVTIPTQMLNNVVVVPVDAVRTENDVSSVFVVEDGKVVSKTVKLGITDDRSIAITEGIAPGEQIIVKGQDYVTAGTPVRIMETQS